MEGSFFAAHTSIRLTSHALARKSFPSIARDTTYCDSDSGRRTDADGVEDADVRMAYLLRLRMISQSARAGTKNRQSDSLLTSASRLENSCIPFVGRNHAIELFEFVDFTDRNAEFLDLDRKSVV